MFAGLGHYEIEVNVDRSAAHAFFHRRGVGRMKHIDSRILWLQDLIAAGGVRFEEDTEDTKFGRYVDACNRCEPLMGLRCCSERDKELVVMRLHKPVPIKTVSGER